MNLVMQSCGVIINLPEINAPRAVILFSYCMLAFIADYGFPWCTRARLRFWSANCFKQRAASLIFAAFGRQVLLWSALHDACAYGKNRAGGQSRRQYTNENDNNNLLHGEIPLGEMMNFPDHSFHCCLHPGLGAAR